MSIQSRIQAAIRHAVDTLGKPQVEIARETRMTSSRISQLYHGDAGSVVAEKIFSIARATQCRAEWIVEGSGPMLNTPDVDVVKIQEYNQTQNISDSSIYQGKAISRWIIEQLGVKPEHLVYLVAQDDSMSPTITRGDSLLIDTKAKNLQSENIYAINSQSGGLFVRRFLQPVFGGWIIRSDNDDKRRFHDETLRPEDIYKIQVIGRIVWRSGKI